MEAETKSIITEFNSHEKLPPASLTKIMTSYVAAAEIDAGRMTLDEMVHISETAWQAEGSRMFIREGTEVSVSDLLRGIIVQSGNDASIAIAEHIAGTEDEFARLMNEYGNVLGLEDTFFENSTGLPGPLHLSSAFDSALLSRELIVKYPEHYAIYAEREFTYDGIRQPNRNRLLALDQTVDGVKTGYTAEAGFCLVASSKRDGMRLISVVMGTDSNDVRIRETRKLFNYGFRNFEIRTLASPEQTFSPIPVKDGEIEQVPVELHKSIRELIHRGSFDRLTFNVEPLEFVTAPIARGDEVATLRIMNGTDEVARSRLFAAHDVAESGFFQNVWSWIKELFSTQPTEA